MSALGRDAGAYADQLRQLLPPGAAWQVPAGGTLDGLLGGIAEEFARIDARGQTLIEEADPRTALELLPDWERVAALPDACTGAPDNVGERHAALHHKLTRTGAQSRAAYVELAARAGYVIEIEEHQPLRCGFRVGERCNGVEWQFVWTVIIRAVAIAFDSDVFLAVFRAGSGRAGDRLRGWGALDIECLIRRAAPAHTHVLFAYNLDEDAAFWIDFTL